MEHTENNQIAMKVSGVSIAVNLILSALKLLAGLVAHSGADSSCSPSDMISTTTLWGRQTMLSPL